MATNSTIINDNHLPQINDALAKVQLAQNEINLAKQAGIDVSAQQAQLTDSNNKLLALKRTYFPGQ